jgi:hypothetical protein
MQQKLEAIISPEIKPFSKLKIQAALYQEMPLYVIIALD